MEHELATANAQLPAASGPTTRVINWGGVLKGVAIVAAVVTVGVVAFPAFEAIGGSITAFISDTPALESIAVGVGNVATWIGDTAAASIAPNGVITNILDYVGNLFGAIGNSALAGLGLENAVWKGAEATTNVIAVGGTAAATALAAKAAMPTIHGLQLGADVPVDVAPRFDSPLDNSMLAAQGAQGMNTAHAASHSILHDAAHAAHHAAETSNEHAEKRWSDKFTNRTAFASHTDAVRATQAAKPITQPAASFGEQLNADRANLDAALAK